MRGVVLRRTGVVQYCQKQPIKEPPSDANVSENTTRQELLEEVWLTVLRLRYAQGFR